MDSSISVGAKVYHQQYGIGRSKYSVSSHDGVQVHRDGSAFYGIFLTNNKRVLAKHIKQLEAEGYVETRFKYNNILEAY
jgi:hypothetical protein